MSLECPSPLGRHPVVPSPLACTRGSRAHIELFDEAILGEKLESAVEGGGPQMEIAARLLEDDAHNSRTVLIAARKSQKDVIALTGQG